jgi:predicted transcriptional regulator YheO
MHKEFSHYEAFAQALEALFYPYIEIVIHNLQTNQIEAIFNSFSKRKKGDPSLLEEGLDWQKEAIVFGPYEKRNWDGKRLKAVSILLKDGNANPVGLFCINYDVSEFEYMQGVFDTFLKRGFSSSIPSPLFKDDWQEKINTFLHHYCQKNHLSQKNLSRDQKQTIVKMLYDQGAFQGKNAAQYIADVLGISRASVYKYLEPYAN